MAAPWRLIVALATAALAAAFPAAPPAGFLRRLRRDAPAVASLRAGLHDGVGRRDALAKLAAAASGALRPPGPAAAEQTGRELARARELAREQQRLSPPASTPVAPPPVLLQTCQELGAIPGQFSQDYLSGKGYWACSQGVVPAEQEFAAFTASAWLEKHPVPGSRGLVVGLDRQPFWLIAQADAAVPGKVTLAPYALRAECTHLGCLVAEDEGSRGFVCPCHGSRYAPDGTVLQGPAPRAMGLASVAILSDDRVRMSAWEAPDFRS